MDRDRTGGEIWGGSRRRKAPATSCDGGGLPALAGLGHPDWDSDRVWVWKDEGTVANAMATSAQSRKGRDGGRHGEQLRGGTGGERLAAAGSPA